MKIQRLAGNPIVRPHMDDRMGSNVNGPSLVRVPDWVDRPLGRYYLYFAHHRDSYIRLAYADALDGPWRTRRDGVLDLDDTPFLDHIASPDVHLVDERREIRMYFHGPELAHAQQMTRVAVSADGLRFTVRPELCGLAYFRAWRMDGMWYALAMPGVLHRSPDGFGEFERGPRLFTPDMRHSALKLDGSTLHVLYTNAGDAPERILHSTIDVSKEWHDWTATPPQVVLEPTEPWEGADLPIRPSVRGAAHERVRQLRDPAIYEEADDSWLLYAVAGEHGIALARLWW